MERIWKFRQPKVAYRNFRYSPIIICMLWFFRYVLYLLNMICLKLLCKNHITYIWVSYNLETVLKLIFQDRDIKKNLYWSRSTPKIFRLKPNALFYFTFTVPLFSHYLNNSMYHRNYDLNWSVITNEPSRNYDLNWSVITNESSRNYDLNWSVITNKPSRNYDLN